MESKSTPGGIVRVAIEFPLFTRLVVGTIVAAGLCGILLIMVEAGVCMGSADTLLRLHAPPNWVFSSFQALVAVTLALLIAYLLFAGYRVLVVAPSAAFDQIRAVGVSLDEISPRGLNEIARLAAVTTKLGRQRATMQRAKDSAESEFASQSRRTADSLDMLTRASRTLRQIVDGDDFLRAVLEDLVDTTGARGAAFWIEESAAAALGIRNVLHTAEMPEVMTSLKMSDLMDDRGSGEIKVDEVSGGTSVSLEISDTAGRYGVLIVEFPAAVALKAVDNRLLQSLVGVITLAVGGALRNQRKRRMALMEERAAIARELHDSLAQSLTFLKLQLSHIQSARKLSSEGNHELDDSLSELRVGVDSAYRQVRQLLNAFRGTISAGGLHQAFRRVIDDLSPSTRTSIELDCRLANEELTPDEELHVLQILREALTNVIRHASAERARVSIQDADGQFILSVHDDGRGIPVLSKSQKGLPASAGHYGITIMRERAERLGGEFEIRQSDVFESGRNGTTVVVRFRPHTALRD